MKLYNMLRSNMNFKLYFVKNHFEKKKSQNLRKVINDLEKPLPQDMYDTYQSYWNLHTRHIL